MKSIALRQVLVLTFCKFIEGRFRNCVANVLYIISRMNLMLTKIRAMASNVDDCERVLQQVLRSQVS